MPEYHILGSQRMLSPVLQSCIRKIQAEKNDQKARLGRNFEYEYGDVLTYVRRCMY